MLINQPKAKKKKIHGRGKPLSFEIYQWYDGDVGLSDTSWQNLSLYRTAWDITFYNSPTVQPGAINGHDSIKFDGTNQYGEILFYTPAQPMTWYLVFKQRTYTNGFPIIDARNYLYQLGVSPNLNMYAGGGSAINSDPDIPLDTWDILTCVFDGANSQIRTNLNPPITGNIGIQSFQNFFIATNPGKTMFSDIEIAYLICTARADNNIQQRIIINFLKNRFGL